jgi:excisionase family DNA binding protein
MKTGGVILEKIGMIESLLRKSREKPMTFRETCVYLGIAPSSLYKLTHKNQIPHHKPTGKLLFFFKDEIDMWIAGKS